MDDKEKLKGYIELYKAQLERFDKRRNIEWKVIFGAWAAIFGFTAFAENYLQIECFAISVMYASLWLVFVRWVGGTWYANEKDKKHADVYREHIERLIGCMEETPKKYKKPKSLGFLADWSRQVQIAGTSVLLLFSWYFLLKNSIEQVCCCP